MEPTVAITPEILDRLDGEFLQYSFLQIHDIAYSDGKIVITPENSTARREYQMEPDAVEYLAKFVGLPLTYVADVGDPAAVTMLWNDHIRKRGQDIDVLKAVVRGEHISGFTVRSFHPLRPSAVVNACREAIAECEFERQPCVHGKSIEFALTGPDLREDFVNTTLGTTDIHRFSVGVEFNYVGQASPTIGAYGHRHTCGNFMYSPYGVGGKPFQIFTSEPGQVLARFTECTRQGVEFIQGTMIPKIRATMEAHIPDVAMEIAGIAKKYGLPESVETLVSEAYRTENLGDTVYHMANAFSRAANNDRCPPQAVRKLQRAAGEITVRYEALETGTEVGFEEAELFFDETADDDVKHS
jgi:hypothetical protein